MVQSIELRVNKQTLEHPDPIKLVLGYIGIDTVRCKITGDFSQIMFFIQENVALSNYLPT